MGKQSPKLNIHKKKIITRFKVTRIWPFNPRTMDHQINPNTIYTLHNQMKEKEYDGYYLSEDEDGEMQWA